MSVSAEARGTRDIEAPGLRARHAGRDKPGRTLVLCSDFAANLEILSGFCADLNRPTLCIDRFGPAGRGAASRAMPELASAVIRLAERLDIRMFDLLGMGWGGLLAQQIAMDHAASLGRLVLVATSPGGAMLPGRFSHLRRLWRRDGLYGLALDGRDARRLFGGRSDLECQAVAGALARARPPSQKILGASLVAALGSSGLSRAHRIDVPTLVLAGDDDRIVPLANARLLVFLLVRARLSVLHGAGHWLLIERQAEAVRRIESFLVLDESRRTG